jgi:cyanophycinase
MSAERKPLFLLADSQSLFRSGSESLVPTFQECLQVSERIITKAAYIGASNGDAPEFFELFVAAMDQLNLHDSRMIRADSWSDDRAFMESADLLLLAGGDVDVGWELMKSTGMDAVIAKKYYAGAVVVGVSAGAMQLGMGWNGKDCGLVSDGLKLVPHYIAVHDEREEWRKLRSLVESREEYAKGFGIPFGGAMIYHPDMSMQAVRHPVAEFEKSAKESGMVTGNLLLPLMPAHNDLESRGAIAGKNAMGGQASN